MSDSTWVAIRNKFIAGLSFLVKYIVPVVVSAASLFGLPPGIAKIISLIPALIDAAELAVPEGGSGPAKKQAVLDAIEAMMKIGESQFTGGAKVNFDKYRPLFEMFIDLGVSAINTYAKDVIADDPPFGGA